MSTGRKWPRFDALSVADEILKQLKPACVRIQIAGSIRRCKPYVGDVEILYVPQFKSVQADLFYTREQNCADEILDRLLSSGILAKRANSIGNFTWGERNKLAVHVKSGIPVDLFSTSLNHWFVALVIRTGPKDMNVKLTTGALKQGCKLHAYGGFQTRQGAEIHPKSEDEVFRLCNVPFTEPRFRR